MKTKFNRKKRCGEKREREYGITHLSAGESKVPSVSAFTVGEFTIEPKRIEEKNNIILRLTKKLTPPKNTGNK